MRRRAAQRFIALAFTSVLAFSSAYAQSESPVMGLLERMRNAAQSLSFTGTFVHQQDAVLQSSRITQTRDARQSVTKLQTLEGNRQEVIKQSGEIRIYMPDQQRVKVD
ncbi:MAG: hypothetical protein EBU75_12715, partial [Betaproteobacteria bacterium]|nr:hypothetical protein [Betaproteobacteria bacterium]